MQNLLSLIAVIVPVAWCVYLLLGKKGRRRGDGALLLGLGAALALEICDVQTLRHPLDLFTWQRGALVATSLFPGAWLLFSLSFARKESLWVQPILPRLLLILSPVFVLAALLVPVESFFYSPDFTQERLLFLTRPGFFFSLGLLVFLTVALVQFERTLAAMPRHARWGGKFELIGAGVLLTMYLVYFSQGLLQRTINMDLLPVRSLALIGAVGLMAYSRLQRDETVRIHLSREMAFRSVVVLVVGCYLIGLGLLGESMRFVEPRIQQVLLTAAGLLGGLAVVTVFLSETAKRKIRVFLHKNFYEKKYDYREQWQRFTRQLSAARSQQELHQAIPAFFAETFAVQGALLFLREAEGDLFCAAAGFGLPVREEKISADNPLVHRIAADGWVFSSRDPEPAIWEAHRHLLEKYETSLIVPLVFDRTLEGFVLLGRPFDPAEIQTYEDFDLMKMVGRHAASAILNLRLADQLGRARELAAIGKISAFVLHDLKNLVSRLGLMVENAREYLDDPEFRTDMMETLGDTVSRMKKLVIRLHELEEKSVLDLRECDLAEVVAEGVRLASEPLVQVLGEPTPARIDPEEIQKVALNLVLNAVEAGGKKPVQVEIGGIDRAFFRVRDQGCGMDEEFIRTRLFRPFETTKGNGFGIGLYQCRHIVEAHGGSIEVRSTPGEGSEFTVWLPAR